MHSVGESSGSESSVSHDLMKSKMWILIEQLTTDVDEEEKTTLRGVGFVGLAHTAHLSSSFS